MCKCDWMLCVFVLLHLLNTNAINLGLKHQYSFEYKFKRISYEEAVHRIHDVENNRFFKVNCTQKPYAYQNYTVINMDIQNEAIKMFTNRRDESNVMRLRDGRPDLVLCFKILPSSCLGHTLKMQAFCGNRSSQLYLFLRYYFLSFCAIEDSMFSPKPKHSIFNENLSRYRRMVLYKNIDLLIPLKKMDKHLTGDLNPKPLD